MGSAGVLIKLLFTLVMQQTCTANICAPSSCGKIPNISHPFRLPNDPQHCGDKRYELACENNVTKLNLYSAKYYVQAINYHNFTIRLVDPAIQQADCSSIPRYLLSEYNFTYADGDLYYSYQRRQYDWRSTIVHIIYLNCTNPVTDNRHYVNTAPCINGHSNNGYIYAIAGDLLVESVRAECHVKQVALSSLWDVFAYLNKPYYENLSYADIHRGLVFGFELSWLRIACNDHCGNPYCFFNAISESVQCGSDKCYYSNGRTSPYDCSEGIWRNVVNYIEGYLNDLLYGLRTMIMLRKSLDEYDAQWTAVQVGRYVMAPVLIHRLMVGVPFVIGLLIYKWRTRHLSMYENIEQFLQDSNLNPIRYSYGEIKKMTKGFKVKLGEGGFGSVYKGNLRSGPSAAIKILGKAKSKANGQEFISEVATIGRIHHVNVVRLLGFCAEGPKRALVYEFMLNGSLDKYIFSKEGSIPLTYEKIYEISLGIARGIAYLHQGCDIQILHFDIKPHNILLDDNFNPKISDFGLAKLYPVDDSIVTLTAARGTIGYMAPELFYKNIGGVSYKADVYSFGMLLMEMATRRKNLNPHAEHSSQLYAPFWIYDQLNEDKDIELENLTEEEKNIAKKMFIVALWCIQLKPRDRPSMNKVVEMLEGDIESLEMPPKPSLYPNEMVAGDQEINSYQTSSSENSTNSSSYLRETILN